MKEEIQLGDKVKCKITGFVGTATARTEFINGCIQYVVTPKWDKKKGELPEEVSIDSQSLEVITKLKTIDKKIFKALKDEEENGGPNRRSFKMKGC